jgi:hypothetical protein
MIVSPLDHVTPKVASIKMGDRYMRKAPSSHALKPTTDRSDGEFGDVRCDPDAHPPLVGDRAVDAIRRHLAERLVLEGVHVRPQRIALASIVRSGVLEAAQAFAE